MIGKENQLGVIPLSVHDVFDYIQNPLTAGNREYLLRVSYLEIYNESIRDLLSSKSEQPSEPRILNDKRRGVYVSPLKEEIVTSASEVLQILQKGEANRHKSSTEYNDHSSRSHSIFQMVIESRPRNNVEGKEDMLSGPVTISTLSLIDLAGSEKASSTIERRKEGAFINKSLLTLGTVIAKLSEKDKDRGHIPYRDSKLTRILQSSLDGNAKVAVICTISPGLSNFEESTSTLKFASRVKKVVTSFQMTKLIDEKTLLQKYRQEIEILKKTLAETNHVVDKEREQEIDLLKKERLKYEEDIHEQHLARTALKERIDHLTRLILTSSSTPNRRLSNVIVDYSKEKDDKRLNKSMTVVSSPMELKDSYIFSLEKMIEKSRQNPAQLPSSDYSKDAIHPDIAERDKIISSLQQLNNDLSNVIREKEQEIKELRDKLSERRGSGELKTEDLEPDSGSKSSNTDYALRYVRQQQKIVELEKANSQLQAKLLQHQRPPYQGQGQGNPDWDDRASVADSHASFTSLPPPGYGSLNAKFRELEAQLEKERKLRAEEHMKYSQQIAGLEAELTICQAELNVSDLFSNFSST